MNSNPIGVFDSGIGGLTVLRELIKRLPNENFIYVGDTARVPYGPKSKDTVTKYASQIIDFLLLKKVKLIVVACNTVSSNSLTTLKKKYKIPIIGVIEPGVKMALAKTENKKIGVIGTTATIRSNFYETLLKKQGKNISVYSKACPMFVPLVEEGWFNNKISLEVAKKYLLPLKNKGIDTLILGCTHYPMLTSVIKKVVPDVKLINSGKAVAENLGVVLNEKSLFSNRKTSGRVSYYFTDLTSLVVNLGKKILKEDIGQIKSISFE